MASLVTAAALTARLGLDATTASKVEAAGAALAEDEARGVLGSDVYDRVAGLASTGERHRALVHALCLLALAYAIPVLNVRVTERGGVMRATGFDQSRVELLRPNEEAEKADALREQARRLLAYLTALYPPSADEPSAPAAPVLYVL